MRYLLLLLLCFSPLTLKGQTITSTWSDNDNKDSEVRIGFSGQYSTGEITTYGGSLDFISFGKEKDSFNQEIWSPKVYLGGFLEIGEEELYGTDVSLMYTGGKLGFGHGRLLIYGLYQVSITEVKVKNSGTNEVTVGDVGTGIKVFLGKNSNLSLGGEYTDGREFTINLGINFGFGGGTGIYTKF
jgi:hypothetical protein